MNPEIAVIVISLLLILTISSTGLFQFASAFVNIISPSKGEAVPAGSSLTISGTSDDSAQTNCNIQIIVNDNRPYQDTIPVASGDYSQWTFVVNPQYAEIEEGINTITSKATCDSPHEPFLKLDPLTRQHIKHYAIKAIILLKVKKCMKQDEKINVQFLNYLGSLPLSYQMRL